MKLIFLNIELDKHLDRIIPFLQKERPDVVCLDEVLQKDIPRLEKELGMRSEYEPMVLWDTGRDWEPWGTALLSAHKLTNPRRDYYHGEPGILHRQVPGDTKLTNRFLLSAELVLNNIAYRFGIVHFIWTPDGQVSDFQRSCLTTLLQTLKEFPGIVFCGDFNAPRGGEIFDTIATHYTDWIPKEYTSSIDGQFHRAGALPYMVDGLFSTPDYRSTNVRLVSGVSDHMAIVADIERA